MTGDTTTVDTESPDGDDDPSRSGEGDGSDGDDRNAPHDGDASNRADTAETGATPPDGRRWPAWLLPASVVGLFVALPVVGMWVAPGPPMEEGFMLVFPERVLAGDMPNRDFLHLYGPGSLWLLAGVYRLLGVDLWVERLVGLGQIVGLVAGVTYVGYRWGRWIAIGAGTAAAVVIMPAIALTALAWVGGVAFGLWAVIVAVRALDGTGQDSPDPTSDRPEGARARRRSLFLGGLLGGIALLFRPDLVVALGLPFGVIWLGHLGSGRPGGLRELLRTAPRPAVVWRAVRSNQTNLLLGGVLAGASPYIVHAALAGPVNAFNGMVVEPIVDLRPGRSLGFPPSWNEYDSFLNKAFAWRDSPWPLPELADPNQIFLWVPLLLLASALLLGVGIYARRSGSPEGWRLLALALFAAGTLPQAIQRPDTAHLAWVSAVPFALVPPALAEWFRLRRSGRSTEAEDAGKSRPEGRLRFAAAVAPLVLMAAVIPNFTISWYADYVGQTFGHEREGNRIEHRDRTYYYGRPEVAEAARALLADVEEVTEPGDVLIVGPGNFTFTPYSEVYLYFLLPQLEPGTHYIEMDPGVANAEDSGLADELREADVVILSTMYDAWDEPNSSRDPGSPEPDQVLEAEYCLHDRYGANPGFEGRGFYELYVRC